MAFSAGRRGHQLPDGRAGQCGADYALAQASAPLWGLAMALLGVLTLVLAVLTPRILRIAPNGMLLA